MSVMTWACRGVMGLAVVIGGHAWATDPPAALGDVLALLEDDRSTLELLISPDVDIAIALNDVSAIKAALWKKYRAEQRDDPRRLEEHENSRIIIGDAVMRYEHFVIGDKAEDGYPLYIALHGGGGAPARVNDQQWEHMKVYYRDSVKAGVYVATRGMTNTYNLHSVSTSYPAYDRLIENMILFEDVDPNRVYATGFSAGGDGVYQIAPRMADRLAAVNMSAGHPNGVSLINTHNVPFMLQVGERDEAYNRHRVTAEYGGKLDALQAEHPEGYVHEVNIHVDRPHNFRDNDASMRKYSVLADPRAWSAEGARESVERNTNAIAWLDHHERDPLPEKIIWQPAVRANSRSSEKLFTTHRRASLFYWLDLSECDPDAFPNADTIIARIDRQRNAITIEGDLPGALRILLSGDMLDLSRGVTLDWEGGGPLRVLPEPSLRNLLRTLIERGDPNYMFEAAITIGETVESN